MNRPQLLKELKEQGIGSILKNMYENIYLLKIDSNVMDGQISADHGVTQGKHSLCNIFSFYISDMKESVRKPDIPDFTEPNNCNLQMIR